MIKDPNYGYKSAMDFCPINLECLNKEGGV